MVFMVFMGWNYTYPINGISAIDEMCAINGRIPTMPQPPPPEEKPAKRSERFDIPVDPDTLQKATKRAKGKSRLRAIMRIFMRMYGEDELGEPNEDLIEQEQKHAEKKRKK